MKYVISQFFFGWLCRPILLWTAKDFLVAAGWVYLLYWAVSTLKGCKNGRRQKEKHR